MSVISIRSIRYALQGIKYAWDNEQRFRIEVLIACIALPGAVLLPLSLTERIIVIQFVVAVLGLELLNTAAEAMIDLLEPRLHPLARIIKDVLAGTVLVVGLGACIVGAMIVWPHLCVLW